MPSGRQLDQKKGKTINILLASGFVYVFLKTKIRIVIHVSGSENVGLKLISSPMLWTI